MKYLFSILLVVLLTLPVWAQDQKITELTADTSPSSDDLIITVNDPGGTPANRKVTIANLLNTPPTVLTVATLPAAGTAGRTRWISDGDGVECAAGGQSTVVLCYDDGAAWAALSIQGQTTPTLDNVFDQGKTIDGANSLANAVRIGDGTNQWCIYRDSSLGLLSVPCTAANVRHFIQTNQTGGWYDEEAAADILVIDPDAASTLAMYTFGTAYKPKKSIWFGADSLYGDGTQCPSASTAVTINSGPIIPTFICTDNDAASLYGSVRMPDGWDGGTVTFTHVYIQTAADTGVLNGDVACQARSNGEVPSSTWGTEVALDDAAVVGSNSSDQTTSAAATCAGTGVAGGDMLFFRYQLDATGTTTAVATLHHVGFNIEYSVTSLSD